MLERATLDVLAQAAEIGLPEAADVPVAAYDPFFRPTLRKRVAKAVATAKERTTRPNGDHVLRVAFLGAHPKAAAIDWEDEKAVEEAFEALASPFLPPKEARPARGGGAYRAAAAERQSVEESMLQAPPKRRRKVWPVTLSVVGLVGASVLGGIAAFAMPYWTPTPMERFAKTPFGTALGEPLTDLVANASVEGSAEARDAARDALLSKAVTKQIGAPARAALERAVDGVSAATTSEEDTTDQAVSPVFGAVNELNTDLEGAHVPALLHVYATGRFGSRNIWLTSYFVEERADLEVDGRAFRSAWGRRLDTLNLADSSFYKADGEDWIVVSVEHGEERFVDDLLTPMAKGTTDEWGANDPAPRAELERKASTAAANELLRVSGATPADADALRTAIAHRNDTASGLAGFGYVVKPSSRIYLRRAQTMGLERAGTKGGYEGKLANEVLRLDSRMRVVAKPLAPAVAELVRLEEELFVGRLAEDARVQALPEAEKLAFLEEGPLAVLSLRGRAIGEAELAALAREHAAPHLLLWLVFQQALDRRSSWDQGAAILVLEELFAELGLPVGVRGLSDDAFVRAAAAAVDLPEARVREAAAKVHARLFSRPAPALRRNVRR